MKEKIRLEWFGTVGGLLALLSFFLPFEPDRSLFAILENTSLPFFSPSLVLLTAAALALRERAPYVACLLNMGLLLAWLFLLALILWVFTPAVLGWMGPGAPLMTLGLLVMLFSPYAA